MPEKYYSRGEYMTFDEEAKQFEDDIKKMVSPLTQMRFNVAIIENPPYEPGIGAEIAVKDKNAFKELLTAMNPQETITIYKIKDTTGISYGVVYMQGLLVTVRIGKPLKKPFLEEWRSIKFKKGGNRLESHTYYDLSGKRK